MFNPAGGMSGANGIKPMTMIAAVIRPSSATKTISNRRNRAAALRECRNDSIDAFGILPSFSIFQIPFVSILKTRFFGVFSKSGQAKYGQQEPRIFTDATDQCG